MCSPAVCRDCRKMTYSGCGMHVEQVLARYSETERCACEPPARRSWFGW